MVLRTSLFNNLGISAGSSFSLYGINDKGRPVAKSAFEQNGKLMRLTNFNVSLDFDLGKLIMGDNSRGSASPPPSPGTDTRTGAFYQDQDETIAGPSSPGGSEDRLFDDYGYSIFDVPWSMRVSYNLSYSKPSLKSNLTQTLSVNGNVTLTKKTAITYTSGFDFTQKEITMTQIGISRDLHCWDMSFNWIPNGTMKMWNFTIRVKAAVLSDLKYERRRDYHDEY
jgi:hypothetical protein